MDSMELLVREVNEKLIPRRKIRNIIHRLRSKRLFDQYDKDRAIGIKLILEPQFREVIFKLNDEEEYKEKMSWENFTFLWDIHPEFPLKTILSSEWIHAGGGYTKMGLCKPTAFTQQMI